MSFWDSSAVTALLAAEAHTQSVALVLEDDPSVHVWWGTVVECVSGICRRRREGVFTDVAVRDTVLALDRFLSASAEIEPSEIVRSTARRLLRTHSLRSADAFQLAAAIVWAGQPSANHGFVCLDQRLRDAASIEGFRVLPEKADHLINEEQP